MKPSQNGIEHNLQNSVEEGASAPMLQVERKSSPSTAEFAFEGQDTLGQDCSLEVCGCTVASICLHDFTWMMILSYIIKISFQNSSAKHIFLWLSYVCSARFGVVCNSAPFFNNLSCAI